MRQKYAILYPSKFNGIVMSSISNAIDKHDKYVKKMATISNLSIYSCVDNLFAIQQQRLVDPNKSSNPLDPLYTKAPLAFSRLLKYANYLSRITNDALFNQEQRVFMDMCKSIEKGDYEDAIGCYDQKFSESDWRKAEIYFDNNPKDTFCGSKEGLMYSYIKAYKEIIRKDNYIGNGAFGQTKAGYKQSDSSVFSAIKMQKIKTNVSELELSIEAEINFDLGVATSGLVIRRDRKGDIYKVYQNMHDLGHPIIQFFEAKQLHDDERFTYAIELLLKVEELHAGKISKLKKSYAHCDIKPGNVLVDKRGELHLIDFGITRDAQIETPHVAVNGTSLYMPKSFDPLNATNELINNKNLPIQMTPTYFFDDKIATLRTIYHQLTVDSILTTASYQQLPSYVSNLLDTSNIQACIDKHEQHSLKYIAAVFILYRYDKDLCTEEAVNALVNDELEQDRLINEYQHAKSQIKGADKARVITLLLGKEITLKYLTSNFSADPDIIRASKDPKPFLINEVFLNAALSEEHLDFPVLCQIARNATTDATLTLLINKADRANVLFNRAMYKNLFNNKHFSLSMMDLFITKMIERNIDDNDLLSNIISLNDLDSPLVLKIINIYMKNKSSIAVDELTTLLNIFNISDLKLNLNNDSRFDNLLTLFAQLRCQLFKFIDNQNIAPAQAMLVLYVFLAQRTSSFAKNEISQEELFDSVRGVIQTYEPVLAEHRGIKQMLYDILNAILFIPCLLQYAVTNQFRLFNAKTTSITIVEDIIDETKKLGNAPNVFL